MNWVKLLEKEELLLCLSLPSNVSDAVKKEFNEKSKKAVILWLSSLEGLVSAVPEVKVVNRTTCEEDLNVVYSDERGTYANPYTSTVLIERIKVNEYYLQGKLIHEFGHIFGLDDTCQPNSNHCKPGFPNSIMCQTPWETILDIDREPIRRVYCLQTGGKNPVYFNHKKNIFLHIVTGLTYDPIRDVIDNVLYANYFECLTDDGALMFFPYEIRYNKNSSYRELSVYSQDEASFFKSVKDNSLVLDFSYEDYDKYEIRNIEK